MKFRIDIGPESLKKHFSERKSMKNREKSPKSTAEPRGCRQLTMGVPIEFFWKFLKNLIPIFFFEHETKTQKSVRYVFSIRSSAHVAQFLDRLEHSECTNLFGNFFFRENVTKIPENGNEAPIVR